MNEWRVLKIKHPEDIGWSLYLVYKNNLMFKETGLFENEQLLDDQIKNLKFDLRIPDGE